jgi:prophage maintenance system killer protein
MTMQNIEIYQTIDGKTDVKVRFEGETLWLTQSQIAELFGVQVQNITMHIKNIYKEQELIEIATCKEFLQVQTEGKRAVERKRKHYSLDMIISVGYRVHSSRATQFRIWATQRLQEYLTQGYTINHQRFEQNAQALEAALKLVKKTAQSAELTADAGRGLVEIVSRYSQTFLWLQRYDEGLLNEPQGTSGGQLQTAEHAMQLLTELKHTLISKGEATELFAKPRGDGLSALLGNLEQSVFGEPAYPTIQSKAAHLLYFTVKNHPFTDGNKRSGAFLFVDFLHRNNHLFNKQGEPIINDTGLAALTLLVAESKPEQKETLIALIMNMLAVEESDR